MFDPQLVAFFPKSLVCCLFVNVFSEAPMLNTSVLMTLVLKVTLVSNQVGSLLLTCSRATVAAVVSPWAQLQMRLVIVTLAAVAKLKQHCLMLWEQSLHANNLCHRRVYVGTVHFPNTAAALDVELPETERVQSTGDLYTRSTGDLYTRPACPLCTASMGSTDQPDRSVFFFPVLFFPSEIIPIVNLIL